MLWLMASVLAAGVWGYLLLGHGGFWRLREWLPDPESRAHWPAVAVLVPARDEAASIGQTVRSILSQDYPGPVNLVVTDDQSTDGTADAARAAAAGIGAAGRLQVVAGTAPPPGWSGKLWALEQARRAVATGAAATPYLWLTDADIIHAPTTLRRLVIKAETDDRDLVSLMVRLAVDGVWARLLIPPFVLFFRMLYPFARANRPGRGRAAAAGGCILLRAAAFERAGGFLAIASCLIDDCALAERIKAAGRDGPGRIWIGQADGSASLRPYRHLEDIWRMVARTAFAELRFSLWRLLGAVAGLGFVFVMPVASVLLLPWHGSGVVALLGAGAWSVMALVARPILRHDGQSPFWGLALPLAAGIYLLMTLDSARAHWSGRGGQWKGRVQAGSGFRPMV